MPEKAWVGRVRRMEFAAGWSRLDIWRKGAAVTAPGDVTVSETNSRLVALLGVYLALQSFSLYQGAGLSGRRRLTRVERRPEGGDDVAEGSKKELDAKRLAAHEQLKAVILPVEAVVDDQRHQPK